MKLFGILVSIIFFLAQVVSLIICLIMFEKNAWAMVGGLSSLFGCGLFFPIWCISFLNTDREWQDVQGFEKGFVCVMALASAVAILCGEIAAFHWYQ